MPAHATAKELAALRALLAELTGQALDDVEVGSAEELELLVLGLLPPFLSPELPPEAARLLPAALAERGDELAAGLLAAVAAFGSPDAVDEAQAALKRLAAADVVSPLAAQVGSARAVEAFGLGGPEDDAELIGVIATRPGEPGAHPISVMLEHEPCGGVVVDAVTGEAGDLEGARALFVEAEPLSMDDAAERLHAALDHMVDHEIPLPAAAAEALPFVERALTGDVAGWPRPAVAPPEHDDADALASAFAEHLEAVDAEPLLLEHAPSVAHDLLTWKGEYGDGELGRWSSRDLRAFLLEWLPRKGDVDDDAVAAVPPSLIAFFDFLAEEGMLAGSPERLAAAVRRLAPDFERRSRDPRYWGPAKALVTQMRAEGVEPTDQESLDAWLADFNGRPFEERDRVLGAALGPAPATVGGNARKRKRQAASQARKRNRRR